ncbi:hypothetical protein BU26DRAFT_412053 [Trematosphaeria pertusa]|uniref:F-box domain-containing protein n=1 Tax=Trematosphaeria pertusa TaxID=390896 RepID=A0A6A6IZZ9_9PLEO|nr:uncharacterized protein BU26DRAFT_412053 [Trematosphaeria pertusa]KAF2255818.1 hypothetical protein BU26DRAFT_412053 [Trematosphaeria pertusa]
MARLTDLPLEIVTEVFHHLGSIDDVHHFQRACRKTHDAIQSPTVYTDIMRSVIGNAPQHRFDISLSRMLDLHHDIVRHYSQGGGAIPLTQTPADCAEGPCTDCLPDARIDEIVARYQGLKVLRDQWLARQLKSNDLLAANSSTEAHEYINKYDWIRHRDEDFQDDGVSRLSPETESYANFNPDQQARFYAALTSVWLFNEIRWTLAQFAYPSGGSFNFQTRLADDCKKWIHGRTERPILDELDRYAVFQFMYHHLLPLHGRFLADRNSSKLPLTFPSELRKSSVFCARFLQAFLVAGQAYFQPPDIIDLIVRSRLSRKPPYPMADLPDSSEKSLRPYNAVPFSADLDYSTEMSCPSHVSHRLLRNTMHHLHIVKRASIFQASHIGRPFRYTAQPATTELFNIDDLSAEFFKDRALVAFEKYEKKYLKMVGEDVREDEEKDIRKVFKTRWPKVWWMVWWWANSEEKARAKMERWREEVPPPRAH